jgi:hypothetical protein
MKTHLMILLVLVAAMFTGANANACDGNCYGGGGGWDGGWGWGALYNSLDYNVPYFAAHPPVYYSYPVPRTYGYSPFAYPPGVMTPEVQMGAEAPVEIINPYVPSSQQTSDDKSDQTATTSNAQAQPEPLVIMNPFVQNLDVVAKAGE